MNQTPIIDDSHYGGLTRLYEQSRFDEVLMEARHLLVGDPGSCFLWKAFGSSLIQRKKSAEALVGIERAILINANDPEALVSKAIVLFELNRRAEGLVCHLMATAVDIGNPVIYYNRGLALGSVGRHDEAIRSYRRSITIDALSAVGWGNLGNSLLAVGRQADALNAYERALVVSPNTHTFWSNLGVEAQRRKQFQDALAFHLRAVFISGELASESLCNLGVCLMEVEDHARAVIPLTKALIVRPDHVKSLNNLSIALRHAARLTEAVSAIEKALGVAPSNAEAWNNRGTNLRSLGQSTLSLRSFEISLSLKPDFSEALTNRGTALLESRRIDDAVASFERAFTCDPNNHSARWNAALACLSKGDFRHGWLLHEHRFAAGAVRHMAVNEIRTFDPSRDRNSRVLVWGEQGIGDEVMFSSMIADFHGMVGKLVVQTEPRLVPIFRRSFDSSIEVIDNTQYRFADDFDSHLAMGSLGMYVRNSVLDFQRGSRPYLKADPSQISARRREMEVFGDALKIGISWRSTNPETGPMRTIELHQLCEELVCCMPGARLISLQYGVSNAEFTEALRRTGVAVYRSELVDPDRDMDGMAALIAACDGVLTIGNTVAHLSGALGKPTVVMLPFAASWRWMSDGEKTPWYPSIRLFRKDHIDADWRPILKKSMAALCRYIAETTQTTGPVN